MSSLIMLPIYARFLTPADYGIIELMTMSLDLMGMLLCNRVAAVSYRYYFMATKPLDKAQTLNAAFVLLDSINSAVFLLLAAFSGRIADFINPEPDFRRIFVLFAITLVFEAAIK